MSFKENSFIAMNRSETSTLPDFISSCGGLLGLFMGVSVLSLIELVYFFTLRLGCKMRQRQQTQIVPPTWTEQNAISVINERKFNAHG